MRNYWQLCIFIFVNIFFIDLLIDWLIDWFTDWLGKIWQALVTLSEFDCFNELLILTNNQIFIVVWQCGQLESFGVQTDCFTQLHLSHPEELGMLLTTPYVVCGTGCVGAVGRAPGGHTRSLSKQIFALIKVALEMKYQVWFYNFHNWDSRGFLINHSRLPAGPFLKKSACYKFFPPSNLMLLDYIAYNGVALTRQVSPPYIARIVLSRGSKA